MRIRLFDGPVKTTPAMLQYVDRHVNASIGRFSEHIMEVRVTLSDENGPKGPRKKGPKAPARDRENGAPSIRSASSAPKGDKLCVMIASLDTGESVIAQERGADHYKLIAAAANTLKRRLTRVGQRTRTRRRGDRRTAADAAARRPAPADDGSAGRLKRGGRSTRGEL